VQRTITTLLAFFAITGTLLVVPVYAAPGPDAEPVETFAEEVALGSVGAPTLQADVQQGTTEPVAGVEATVPVLTVREADVPEFSLVGVSWAYDPAVTDTLIQVSVKDADGDWGGWTEVETEIAGPDADTDSPAVRRGGTEPLWTGPSTGVEVELVTRSGAQPTDVRLSLVDPGQSPADAALETPEIQDTAQAATAMPPVYSRTQWGADESLMTWTPSYSSTIKAGALHHTAGSNDYTSDEVPAILRAIYRYHAVTLGWGDIGYNVLVDKYGRTWEGRAGGLASTVVGGHTGGFNTDTFGISMIGNYDTAPTTQRMVDAVSAVMAWKLSLYGVDPNGTTTLTSGGTNLYPAGEKVVLPTILAHRDTKSTACPGKYGYAKMSEIRAKATFLADSASFARSLYDHMMGRVADEGGVRNWTNVMSVGGWNRRQVSSGFANSTEYRRLVITQSYQQVLGRTPDPGGLDFWMAELAKGTVRLDTLRPVFMSSEEFYLRGGSSDSAFVDNIYQAALGRGASSTEIAYWADVRKRKGAAAVISGVWGAPEAAMRRVGQAYQYYLGRPASRSEQEHWLPVVAGSGDEQLREEIVVSREYALRAESRFP
jgi:hypothetical protein